jgi:HSP20 family protein
MLMALFDFPNPSRDDSWTAFDQLRRELGGVLGNFAPEGVRTARSTVFPPVNLYETDSDWVLTAEVPGLRPEALDVSVDGARVTLRGERKIEIPDQPGTSVHRRERQAGIFRRTFELPSAPQSDKIEATYRHGVLRVRLPKPAARQARQITIQPS